ncbi:hypothetical protein DFJ73DRAFT_862317 [Zopfochytrium polystomum]|nr:hypothetical protein DFJ73DRAFT_862317 [Zopfochytrium polystomum]
MADSPEPPPHAHPIHHPLTLRSSQSEKPPQLHSYPHHHHHQHAHHQHVQPQSLAGRPVIAPSASTVSVSLAEMHIHSSLTSVPDQRESLIVNTAISSHSERLAEFGQLSASHTIPSTPFIPATPSSSTPGSSNAPPFVSKLPTIEPSLPGPSSPPPSSDAVDSIMVEARSLRGPPTPPVAVVVASAPPPQDLMDDDRRPAFQKIAEMDGGWAAYSKTLRRPPRIDGSMSVSLRHLFLRDLSIVDRSRRPVFH